MDLKQIKQIIDLMKRSELSEFEFEEEGFKIKIKRGAGGQPIVSSAPPTAHPFPMVMPANPASTKPSGAVAESAGSLTDEAGFTYVKSPMVGTFYRSPSPENPSFVENGTKVEEKSVVCIIEAMKIMNEIEADCEGKILRILCENGQAVEFGQPLFIVE